jgi:hypothetical protein
VEADNMSGWLVKHNNPNVRGLVPNEFNKIKELISNSIIKVVGSFLIFSLPFLACEVTKENPLHPIDPREPDILFTSIPGALYVGTADSAKFVIHPNAAQVYSVEFTVRDRTPNFYQCVCELDNNITGIAKWNVQPIDTGLTVLRIIADTDIGTFEEERTVQSTWSLETVQLGVTSSLDTVRIRITDTESFYINLKPDTSEIGKAEILIMDPLTAEVSSLKIQEGESRIIYRVFLGDETKRFALKINEVGLDYVNWSLDVINE